MKGYIGITAYEWWNYIKERNFEYINFWNKKAVFKALKPGDLFFFLKKNEQGESGERSVVGYAEFYSFEYIDASSAWEKYKEGNGYPNKNDFAKRVLKVLGNNGISQIGCIILKNYRQFKSPVMLSQVQIEFSNGTVSGKAIKEDECQRLLKAGKDVVEKRNDELEEINDSRRIGASNILLYGVPGAGKSFEIKTNYLQDARENEIERVVFHPDYTYSDFVGQILPRLKMNAAGEEKLEYAFVPGPFTKMLKKAVANPKQYYYLIIEEINRGNAPAIFGEVFQLMDRKDSDKYSADVVGESEYGITNFDVAREVYGDEEHEIRIPSNMYIIATMNTADQNVFTLDTAFQRRWNMRHIKNDVFAASHAKEKIQGTNVSWGQFAYVINNLVVEVNSEVAASEDKRLGAYFVKKNELVPDKFSEKVLKYLWDDAFKLNREEVFKPDYKSLDVVIENYERTSEDRLKAILRSAVYEKMIASSVAENESDDNTTPNE